MRLGIISDTHGVLPAEVHDIFSKVDKIIHAGDIGGDDIVYELEAIAPLTAVYGNTDGFDIRGKFQREAKFELDGLYFTVTHGDQFGRPAPVALRQAYPEADVLIYGHTHEALLEVVDKTVTVMNPDRQVSRGRSVGVGWYLGNGVRPAPRARLVPSPANVVFPFQFSSALASVHNGRFR